MAAAGIGNPVGYVPIMDGGNPRIIGGIARANISGGVFCFASGADAVVSSGANSFVNTDLLFAGDASGNQFTGICMQDTGSNTEISIVTRAAVLCVANGDVVVGGQVVCDGNNAVAAIGSTASSIHHSNAIGRALTGAGSEEYCLVDINL